MTRDTPILQTLDVLYWETGWSKFWSDQARVKKMNFVITNLHSYTEFTVHTSV